MRILIALIAGTIFSGGLIISGMTDTQKVQGFLDLFGAWDPTLVFVMGGAIIPMLVAWQISERMSGPIFASNFPTKPLAEIDAPLVVGSILFGIGWGLSGFCPGPAMTSLTFGGWSSTTFFVAMAAGMFGFPYIRRTAFG